MRIVKDVINRLIVVLALLAPASCTSGPQQIAEEFIEEEADESITIENLMDTMFCEGFDYPAGNADGKGKYTSLSDGKEYDSWYIASGFAESYSLGIHTGIDMNGTGGGNTDKGQPVYSAGRGIVVAAEDYGSPWGNVVMIRHKYLENGKINYCYSLYAHLNELFVKAGDYVPKRMKIGTIGDGNGAYLAHLHFEIRKNTMKDYEVTYWPSSNSKDAAWVKDYYHDPSKFIDSHRKLIRPCSEERIILVIKHLYTMYYYENGKEKKVYEIALSQNPIGHKQKQGDLKMPEGEYYITAKEKGPFYGDYSEYLGPCLIRISYPNSIDADSGLASGLINKTVRDNIVAANQKKVAPPQNSALGGGIVIHGWSGEWYADGNQNLTWGCVCMHNTDIEQFFEVVEKGTGIVILP
jgi:murein L,D-transpeptidase YafK